MAVILVDSHDISNYDAYFFFYVSGYTKHAQSLTGKAGKLVQCKWFLYGHDPLSTGDIYAKLYTHSGTYGESSIPTGDPLAASNPINVSNLPYWDEPPQLTSFDFEGTNQHDLQEGVHYCISIEYPSGDGVHAFYVGNSYYGHATHPGNQSRYKPNAWELWPLGEHDLVFYVYAEDGIPPAARKYKSWIID